MIETFLTATSIGFGFGMAWGWHRASTRAKRAAEAASVALNAARRANASAVDMADKLARIEGGAAKGRATQALRRGEAHRRHIEAMRASMGVGA